MKIFISVSLPLVLLCSPAHAYELGTHARITYKAYEASTIFLEPTLLEDLGLKNHDVSLENPFGKYYLDVNPLFRSNIVRREKMTFEEEFMQDESKPPAIPKGTDPLSIPGWLMRGAIREDDYTDVNFPVLGCRQTAPNPRDDPYPEDRPVNHFFDPFNNEKQNAPPWKPSSFRASDWALGTLDLFAQDAVDRPNIPYQFRRNHFTVFDAREAMYRALTGKKIIKHVMYKAAQTKRIP